MSTLEPPVWLNKAFLESSLRAGYDDTLSIGNYDIKTATAKGDNYTSTMYRVTVETTGNKTFSVLIKYLLEAGKSGDMLRQSTAHLREATMLSVMLPKMTALLQDAMPGKFFPRSRNDKEGLLIMEDLSPLGFKMAKRQKGLDLSHCLLVMRKLGRFHATSVLIHQQDPDSMANFQTNLFIEHNNGNFSKLFAGLLRNAADEVETWPESSQYAGKIRAYAEDIVGCLRRVTARDDSAFNVLNHGDLWVNNMLFRYSKTGQPESMLFVDYQLCNYASPALDLQYFMNTSPTDDVRMRHTDTLLQVGQQQLTKNYSQL
ncbi:hypothetical protein L798_10414, partial [Zootermopsis nevadensis]